MFLTLSVVLELKLLAGETRTGQNKKTMMEEEMNIKDEDEAEKMDLLDSLVCFYHVTTQIVVSCHTADVLSLMSYICFSAVASGTIP